MDNTGVEVAPATLRYATDDGLCLPSRRVHCTLVSGRPQPLLECITHRTCTARKPSDQLDAEVPSEQPLRRSAISVQTETADSNQAQNYAIPGAHDERMIGDGLDDLSIDIEGGTVRRRATSRVFDRVDAPLRGLRGHDLAVDLHDGLTRYDGFQLPQQGNPVTGLPSYLSEPCAITVDVNAHQLHPPVT
ncbi:hypothetical protein PSPO01_02048 [Paraphaeosphaeria sporulosa]